MTLEELKKEIRALPYEDRLRILQKLLKSIEHEQPTVKKARSSRRTDNEVHKDTQKI
jgi:hypothetical protein